MSNNEICKPYSTWFFFTPFTKITFISPGPCVRKSTLQPSYTTYSSCSLGEEKIINLMPNVNTNMETDERTLVRISYRGASCLKSCYLHDLSSYTAWIFNKNIQKGTVCIQGYQFYVAVFFWYLGISDFSSVHLYSSVHWTSRFLKETRKNGHVNWSPCIISGSSSIILINVTFRNVGVAAVIRDNTIAVHLT